jgi:hypothetical protein
MDKWGGKGYLVTGNAMVKMLWVAFALVFLMNLPFGYWRSRVRRFSMQWILAVHTPVPFVVACRILLGLGWHLVTFPVLIGAFFAGQFMGSRLQKLMQNSSQ